MFTGLSYKQNIAFQNATTWSTSFLSTENLRSQFSHHQFLKRHRLLGSLLSTNMTASTALPPSLFLSSFSNPNPKLSIPAINLRYSHTSRNQFINRQFSSIRSTLKCSQTDNGVPTKTEEEDEKLEDEGPTEKRRKVFVVNLPWDFSAPDVEKLFGECGTVKDVEIIKKEQGKNRGFAFVTMANGKEAQTVIDKFDSFEVMERVITVEFAKSFKKPPPPPQPKAEGKYKIYASNLAWKVRSNNLRDFFAEKFKPLSARVVFDSPSGRSAGYGFVGFATEEEALAAISELDGKELMERPLKLKISQKPGNETREEQMETDRVEQKHEDS